MNWLHSSGTEQRLAALMVLVALALLLLGLAMIRRALRQNKNQQAVERALSLRTARQRPFVMNAEKGEKPGGFSGFLSAAAAVGARWSTQRFSQLLLAEEDRQLIESAGYTDQGRARALFLFSRAVLGVGLPLLSLTWSGQLSLGGNRAFGALLSIFLGFALGMMLPKWTVQRHARQRKADVKEELPLFVDLLRLLQGVGLSIDQSLHVVVHDFREVMPVLASELAVAVEQYIRGRSREQSLARLAHAFDNEDLAAICRLIVQIDQHGGAVQQPLHQFSERLREQRKLDLKERVGKLTVKMTGVMVLTLMPALLIITGGAGFLAIIRALSSLGGN